MCVEILQEYTISKGIAKGFFSFSLPVCIFFLLSFSNFHAVKMLLLSFRLWAQNNFPAGTGTRKGMVRFQCCSLWVSWNHWRGSMLGYRNTTEEGTCKNLTELPAEPLWREKMLESCGSTEERMLRILWNNWRICVKALTEQLKRR